VPHVRVMWVPMRLATSRVCPAIAPAVWQHDSVPTSLMGAACPGCVDTRRLHIGLTRRYPISSARTIVASAGIAILLAVCGACSSYRSVVSDGYPSFTSEPNVVFAPQELAPPVVSLEPLGSPLGQGAAAGSSGSVLRASLFDTAGRAGSGSQITEHQLLQQAAWEAECLADVSPLRSFCRENTSKLWTDHGNFYSSGTMRDLLLGIGAGGILANTSLDEDFQDWYQDDVRSSGTDDFAAFSKAFGDGQFVIPAVAGLAVMGAFCDYTPCGDLAKDFGCRSTRAYFVGAPPTLLLQFGLGASRPGQRPCGSHWKPFDDVNSVSGHAFVGAVPFITAAKMSENRYLKGGLYLCSTFTAWSRVNDDRHYLSQACLGWWIAYLACRAVDDTEFDDKHLALSPIASPDMVGVGAVYRR
jgi:hypothetical protein